MALSFRKLRNLLSLNMEDDPDSGDSAIYRDIEAPSDPGLFRDALEAGSDPGIYRDLGASPAILPPPRTSPATPLPKLGRTSTTTLPNPATNGGYAGGGPPQQSFGRRLRGAIPGILDAAIAAGATQNVAGGGPTDIFRAAKAVGDEKTKKQAQAIKLADQRAQEQLRLSQIPWWQQRPTSEAAKQTETETHHRNQEATGGANASTAASRAAETARNNRANNAIHGQANVITGARSGYEVPDVTQPGGLGIVPPPSAEAPTDQPAAPIAGHPAIRPIPRENLSPQQKANLDKSSAQTELYNAQATVAGQTPVHYNTQVDDKGNATTTALPGRVKPGEAPKPLGDPLVQAGAGKTKAQPQGSFITLVGDKGEITGFHNPKTGETKGAPEGARKAGLPPAENVRRAMLEVQMEDAATLEALGHKYQKHIGFVKGRLDDVQRKTIGVDEGINDMFRISDNLADMLLRARSGAAINEGEYVRLRALMPDPRSPYVKFKSDLRLYQSEIKRLYEKSTGRPAPVAETAPEAPGPKATKRFNPATGKLEAIP